jgi:CheY-like chemotaxis protein
METSGKILLVEDDPNDAKLTVMALTENHLANEIVITRDGEEALDFLYRRGAHESREAGNPIVVLLDLKLPKVDGLEVLKQVKSDPDLRTIPVVMLTSIARGARSDQELRSRHERVRCEAGRLRRVRRIGQESRALLDRRQPPAAG